MRFLGVGGYARLAVMGCVAGLCWLVLFGLALGCVTWLCCGVLLGDAGVCVHGARVCGFVCAHCSEILVCCVLHCIAAQLARVCCWTVLAGL